MSLPKRVYEAMRNQFIQTSDDLHNGAIEQRRQGRDVSHLEWGAMKAKQNAVRCDEKYKVEQTRENLNKQFGSSTQNT